MPHSMSDLSSLTRDQTHDPLQQKQSLHPWTSREVPGQLLGPTFFQSSGRTCLTAYQAPAKREGLGCVVKGRAGTVLNKAFELRLAGGKDLDTLPGGSDSRKFCRLSHTHTHTHKATLWSHTLIYTLHSRGNKSSVLPRVVIASAFLQLSFYWGQARNTDGTWAKLLHPFKKVTPPHKPHFQSPAKCVTSSYRSATSLGLTPVSWHTWGVFVGFFSPFIPLLFPSVGWFVPSVFSFLKSPPWAYSYSKLEINLKKKKKEINLILF